MLPASNRGAGMNLGFPDVCLTPAAPAPIPVPYPNIAMNAQAQAFSTTVKISGVNALNLGSVISMTTGDEGGSAHPTIKGMGKYTMGNPLVNIDKLPAINLALPTTGNMMNNGLGLVAVPSAVNVVFCLAGVVGDRIEEGELARLADAMRDPDVRVEALPAGVAHVRIGCFAPGTRTDLDRALRTLGPALRAVLVDLRGCPGGDLEEAVHLAADFLEHGEARVDLDEDGEPSVVRAAATARFGSRLIVLVDRGTASAAEVFAAVMQRAGRGTVVGARSFGKGTAQHVVPSAGPSLRAEVGSWAVGGRPGSAGVVPDVELAGPGAEDDLWLKTAWALALR